MTSPCKASVVGTGLIGASIGLALRRHGWHVSGIDLDEARASQALELGAVDVVGPNPDAELTFIATPAGATASAANRALTGGGIVTDVAGVKAGIVDAVDHPRFVGGHPMAGSEQEGVEGADSGLFEGATWVLTPTDRTDPQAYARLRAVVSLFGANVIAMAAERHDEFVAMVSHVPHLTAAALMTLAAEEASEQGTLLRLAAGGFRDMTRIAAGHPGIWPDVCVENQAGISETLDRLTAALARLREMVAGGDRDGILAVLERAREARLNLPSRVLHVEDMVEVRVPVPDRPGVLAEVTTLLGELSVNIYDLEIAHSAEGERGVLVLAVDTADAELARGALLARHYRPAVRPLA
jgi:prephenate dehydrogenase